MDSQSNKIWAIADLHLAVSCPDKNMERFGSAWNNYHDRLAREWRRLIADSDIVLIPGDICWAMSLEEAALDIEWIAKLPGRKIIGKGNHDYWWASNNKVRQALPTNFWALDGDAMVVPDTFGVAGVRLWDTTEFNYSAWIDFVPNPKEKEKNFDNEKIFQREIHRLELALQQLQKITPAGMPKIAMLHYPPFGPEMKPTSITAILEKYGVDIVLFGHLHSLNKDAGPPKGEKLGAIRYYFVAADYLQFTPLLLSF